MIKKLVNNHYISININNLNQDNNTLYNKLKTKILKLLKIFKIT